LRILIDSVDLTQIHEKALRYSEFPSSDIAYLNSFDHPGNARTSAYILKLQRVDALVSVWDGKDMELINLAKDMGLPIFILYSNEIYEYGFRLNWEEDF